MTDEFGRPGGGSYPSGQQPRGGARSTVQDLKDKVADDVAAAQRAIQDGRDTAEKKMKDTFSSTKNSAAHHALGVAQALEKVGEEMEGSDQPQVGRYAREIGRSVRSLAEGIEGKDVGEMATMAEDFGRRQPLAFLGAAALAGLAASRFLTASSKRVRSTGRGEATSNSAPQDAGLTGGRDNG